MNTQDNIKTNYTIKDKFTFFRKQNYIYLDNAATTQVPDSVIKSVVESLSYKGNPHRSAHQLAKRNGKFITLARENIAEFIGASTSEIVFTNNTTDSINLAVEAIAEEFEKNDEILISVLEHNSNVLPFHKLNKKGVKFKIIQLKDGLIDIEDLQQKLSNKTKLIAITHVSNVVGNINDVEQIGQIVHDYNPNIFYCIDGAQAVAHLPVNVKRMQCSFYAFSGHKMYGPDGIGVLYINTNIHARIQPVRAGGGTISQLAVSYEADETMLYPGYYPTLQFLEGGTPNVANIIGLSKAVNFLKSIGMDNIRKHERALVEKLTEGLSDFPEIEIVGKTEIENKIGLVSFTLRTSNVKALGDYLAQQNICIRYGAHCAFLLLDKLQQETLRISFGSYNDADDITALLKAIDTFLKNSDKKHESQKTKELRAIPFYTKDTKVHTTEDIIQNIKASIKHRKNTNVIIMAGHFLGIPDLKKNMFYPSINTIVPFGLQGLLSDFGMKEFPIFTWDMGCEIVASLKKSNISARLLIVVNDTTGINELAQSNVNLSKKTIQEYREDLVKPFVRGLPEKYISILQSYNLSISDIIKYKDKFIMQESVLRGHFKNFIRNNKNYLDSAVEYTGEDDKIVLNFNILNNQDIKSCNVGTFGSKTGGKYCIATVGELLAELFGTFETANYDYIPENIKKPVSNASENMLVMLSPAMCNNAVNSSAELYIKLFTQGKKQSKLHFMNIPLGSEPKKTLLHGVEATYISDKMAG